MPDPIVLTVQEEKPISFSVERETEIELTVKEESPICFSIEQKEGT